MNAEPPDPTMWFRDRLRPVIAWYDVQATRARIAYFSLRVLSLSTASAITVVSITAWTPLGWPSTWLPGVLGAAIVLIESLLGLYHPRDQWLSYRATAEALKREHSLFLAQAGPYAASPGAAAFGEFVVRAEQLIAAENSTWRQVFEQTARQDAEQSPGKARHA